VVFDCRVVFDYRVVFCYKVACNYEAACNYETACNYEVENSHDHESMRVDCHSSHESAGGSTMGAAGADSRDVVAVGKDGCIVHIWELEC
jgi:hypothetical protein